MNQNIGDKSLARKFAFQFLNSLSYSHGQELLEEHQNSSEIRRQMLTEAINRLEDSCSGQEGLSTISKEVKELASTIIKGVIAHISDIDQHISSALNKRDIAAVNPIDLAILRLGTYELLFSDWKTPNAVLISEAINISKTYGGQGSSPFINGVLDRIASKSNSVN